MHLECRETLASYWVAIPAGCFNRRSPATPMNTCFEGSTLFVLRLAAKRSLIILLGTMIVAFLAAGNLGAAPALTWTGAVSSDWSNAANWNPTGVPDATATVLINSGSVDIPPSAAFAVMNWGGGEIDGALTVGAGAVLNLNGSADKLLRGALTNSGTVTWGGTGDLRLFHSDANAWAGSIDNLAGGTFEVQSDQEMYSWSGGESFSNAGLFRKSMGTDTTTIEVVFNNTGTIDIQSGTVSFAGGGALGGQLSEFSGAGVMFASGDFSGSNLRLGAQDGSLRISGGFGLALAGGPLRSILVSGGHSTVQVTNALSDVEISGGELVLNPVGGMVTITNAVVSSGVLGGTNLVLGSMTWSGGEIDGALTVGAGAVLNLNGPADKLLRGTLTNSGTVTWGGTGDLRLIHSDGNGWAGSIDNLAGGTFEVQSDQEMYSWSGGESFSNAGLFRKSMGTGTTTIEVVFNNTGTIDIQSGTVHLSSGLFLAETGAALSFGLSSPVSAGHLSISGGVSIRGALGVNLLNGYAPSLGSRETLVDYGSYAGRFSLLTLPLLGPDLAWQVSYESGAIVLQTVTSTSFGLEITGSVADNFGHPLANVTVYAYTTNSNKSLYLSTQTDGAGDYSLKVPDDTFQVGVQGLAALGYTDVLAQTAVMNNTNTVVSFVTQSSSAQSFAITTQVNPADAGTAAGGGVFLSGAPVTVIASANTQARPYFFASWTENGAFLSASPNYSFAADRDRHLVANFALPIYSIIADNEPPGAGTVSGTGSFVWGTTNTLTASASAGFYFTNWTENGTVVATTPTLTMVAYSNHSLVANFRAIPVNLPDLVAGGVSGPASAPAGQGILVSWAVTNIGTASAVGSWVDEVFLVTDTAGASAQFLAEVPFSGSVNPRDSLMLTQTVVLPEFVSGAFYLAVRANGSGTISEATTANNLAVAAQQIQILPTLKLALTPSSVSESAGPNAVVATLTRSTEPTNAVVVNLASTTSTNLTLPATVTIPPGASTISFPLGVIDHQLVGGPLLESISASAQGFVAGWASLTILENDAPALDLRLSAATVSEAAGTGVVTGTLGRNAYLDQPLTVILASDQPAALVVPPTVTIGAGQSSATFSLTPVNSLMVDDTRRVHVIASAPGFGPVSATIDVLNANFAQLTLQLVDSVVTKGAAIPATIGTVTRMPVMAGSQDVLLTVQGDALVSVPSVVTIPAGTDSASFVVNVGDDHVATGTQTATLTAQALSPAGAIIGAGAATTSLKVLDTAGPSLAVSFGSASVATGSNVVGTVTRNTPPTNEVTVSLSASPVGLLELPAVVVLPVNQLTATFQVQALPGIVPTGSRRVLITAAAAGFNSGIGNLLLSDIYLPDLVPLSVSAQTNGLTGAISTITWVVANQGLGLAIGPWVDNVYLSPDNTAQGVALVAALTNNLSLAVGDKQTNQVSFPLPPHPGNYWVTVASDAGGSVDELSEFNNTAYSPQPIVVGPWYRAAVLSATPSVAPAGTPIQLAGRTFNSSDGSPMPSVAATVRIRVGDTRRVAVMMSDSQGNFTYTFQPLANEVGDYVVSADHPDIDVDAPQAGFALLGFQAVPGSLSAQLTPNKLLSDRVVLTNLTDHPLTGLKVTTPDLQGRADVQFALTNQVLPAGGSVTISYTLRSALSSRAQISFSALITTAEGAQLALPVNVTLAPLEAELAANPAYLERGMVRGQQTLVAFDVLNGGGADTGALNVQLPDLPWLSLVSPAMVPSLPPGGKTTVTLALTPAPTLPLTLYVGNLVLANGNVGVSVPFQFRAISDALGDLKVTVTDDYTYYVAGAPKVTNAMVILRDSITDQALAQATSDVNGLATFTNLREGDYVLAASAAEHNPSHTPVSVVAGVATDAEAFLTRQLVTYQWTVVPSDIPDHYEISLESVFETEVPVPNLVVEDPQVMLLVAPGDASQFVIKLTNQGLIAANGVKINVPDDSTYLIKPLVSEVDVIPAHSSVSIPVTVQLRGSAARSTAGLQGVQLEGEGGGCKPEEAKCIPDFSLKASFFYICGHNAVVQERSVDLSVICTKRSVLGCLKNLWETERGWNGTYEPNLTKVGCGLLESFLDCVGTDLSPCQKAAIGAACGALTEGLPGVVLGGGADLAECICTKLPPDLIGPPAYGQGGIPEGTAWSVSGCPIATGPVSGGVNPDCLQASLTRRSLKARTSGGVCARVRIRIDQSAVMTRTAFTGALEIDNEGSGALTGIRVDLDFRDGSKGTAASKFVVEGPNLSTITAVDGTGELGSLASGSAVYTFIPTPEAAPDAPQTFQIGGMLRYVDNGEEVIVPLLAAPITVYPQARLKLTYFQQRDVYGDDPFTPEVEPSEPFALGLIVKNVGAGLARDFQITSGQPKIVEN